MERSKISKFFRSDIWSGMMLAKLLEPRTKWRRSCNWPISAGTSDVRISQTQKLKILESVEINHVIIRWHSLTHKGTTKQECVKTFATHQHLRRPCEIGESVVTKREEGQGFQ
ncbi:unnamed protein product [Prunus armeniaca]